MAHPKVRLYVRVQLPNGSPFVDPAYSANRKLKQGWAVIDGKPQPVEKYRYYLRYLNGGKRVWEPLTSDAQQVMTAQKRMEIRLRAAAEGVELAPKPTEPDDEPESAGGSRLLSECIDEYLAEVKAHKAKKTHAAYCETLALFRESLGQKPNSRKSIADVSRVDLLRFITFLRERGNSPRTIRNRIDYLQIFLHHFKLPSLLTRADKPQYTEKKVRAYNAKELEQMLKVATEDERDLLYFFLCSGGREQDVQFACWSDVDLVMKAYTVTEHLDLGYRPKDKEEGTIPLPDFLVERLTARRKRYSKSRLIFPGSDGKPNGHLLRTVKALALRAGVNCGHCINKAGRSCAEYAVCRHVILHKLRKTFATRLHSSGVPARTIMSYLRHSDLETTLKYLADAGEDIETRQKANVAFGAFAMAGGAR